MSKIKRILQLADAVDKKLPADAFGSVEEWLKRHSERLRDMGYTAANIDMMTHEARQTALLREEAKTQLDAIIFAKTHTGHLTTDIKAEARRFTLLMLKKHKHFIGLHPGTNLKRYAKHITYLSKKSSNIRAAYQQLFVSIRGGDPYLARVMSQQPSQDVDKFARAFGYRYWSMDPQTEPHGYYEASSFVKCTHTKLEAPTARMASVVVSNEGRTEMMHPSLLATSDVVRDSVSGQLVWASAVEWVTLEDGSRAWRAMNEARGAIYLEDGRWVRGATGGRVAGYHGAPRQWRETGRRSTTYRGHVGVELECGFKSDGHLEKFVNRFVNSDGRFAGNRPFLIERDSSLSSVRAGVEIVSEPLPLYQGYQAPDADWRWLLDKLSHGGAEGWKHRQVAGIHVNTDVSDRTPSQILRFVVFVHNAAAISKFIAGRKQIYGAGDETTRTTPDSELHDLDKFITMSKSHFTGGYQKWDETAFKKATGSTGFDDRALQYFAGRGKYSPVHVRGNGVLETRIFGSNIRYEGFMACVEYCVGGMEFTSGLSSDLAVLDIDISAQFRAWLSDNCDKYPNLASRIGVHASTIPGSSKTVVARPLEELTA